MGAKLGSSGDEGDEVLSDINVTPFVDVVLVLLVIFLIATPALVKRSLDLELPKATSGDDRGPRTLGFAITRSGQFLFEGEALGNEALRERLAKELSVSPDLQAVISADKDSTHDSLVKLMDLLKTAGLNKFALEVAQKKTSESGDNSDQNDAEPQN